MSTRIISNLLLYLSSQVLNKSLVNLNKKIVLLFFLHVFIKYSFSFLLTLLFTSRNKINKRSQFVHISAQSNAVGCIMKDLYSHRASVFFNFTFTSRNTMNKCKKFVHFSAQSDAIDGLIKIFCRPALVYL